MTTDRQRIDALLEDRTRITAERDRYRDIAYTLAADVAVLKGVTPYVAALAAGLLPQAEDREEA